MSFELNILPDFPIPIPNGQKVQFVQSAAIAEMKREDNGDKATLVVFQTQESPCIALYMDMNQTMILSNALLARLESFKKEIQ